ncbi:hypothetical protein B7463_g517, partial [Scytalidium lignicola]
MAPSGSLKLESPSSVFGAGESLEGTPDTRLTAFSPEDTKNSKQEGHPNTGSSQKTESNDPFVSTDPVRENDQKLSPDASIFLPFYLKIGSAATPQPTTGGGLGATFSIDHVNHHLRDPATTSTSKLSTVSQNEQSTFGNFSAGIGATRCLKITGKYNEDIQKIVHDTAKKLSGRGFSFKGSQRIHSIGNVVYLRLSNIDDSVVMHSAIKQENMHCVVEYIQPAIFGQVVNPGSAILQSNHEGQVMMTGKYPLSNPFRTKEFEDGLRAMLSADGSLYAWQKLSTPEADTFKLVVEFSDVALARRAVHRCSGKSVQGIVVSVSMYTPDLDSVPSLNHTTRKDNGSDNLHELLGNMAVEELQRTFRSTNLLPTTPSFINPLEKGSMSSNTDRSNLMARMTTPLNIPVIRQIPPIGGPNNSYINDRDLGHSMSISTVRSNFTQYPNHIHDFNNSMGYSESPQHRRDIGQEIARRHQYNWRSQDFRLDGRRRTNSNNNYVDIDRIKQGIDVRTTVMLRNIPNKVDQATLKSIVDESSHGLYDFMYLRIDFSNNCNVGYAFINFTDPLDIVKFVEMRANKKWHCFKSDKIAEVSYATIQGKDCLVQKFRNSSVMLEPEHCKPKLFFTQSDPYGRAGEEDQFPPVDNPSKLKRSCENAEHIGLFAPSAGHQLRDEQRRRQSQYDRGTSLAEREEYFGRL